MDINDMRGLSTLLMFVAFMGIVFWAYSKRRKNDFEEAANLPFADDEMNRRSIEQGDSNE